MTRYVDLRARDDTVGLCVILPGRQYTPDRPLLSFATEAALAHGWNVRQVWWNAPERGTRDLASEMSWVHDELDAAVHGHDGPVLLIAKSLGTLAAARAADQRYDAAWLTPLLSEPAVADVLLGYPGNQLSVVGSEDPFYVPSVFDALPGTRLLVAGDHVLRVPGDPVAMAESHLQFVGSLDGWLDGLDR